MTSKWDAATAEWYAEKYGEYATNRLGVGAIELSAADVVVDLGCGTGAALRAAAPSVTRGRLVGVDPVPRMVEIAQERAEEAGLGERLEFVVGAASSVPLDDDVADVVLAFDSYDHWEDKPAGLAEVRRLLKPTGQFVVVKDGGVPSTKRAGDGFASDAERAGFRVLLERGFDEEGVTFTLWVLSPG